MTKPRQEQITIAEMAGWRVLGIAVVIAAFGGFFVWLALAGPTIHSPTRPAKAWEIAGLSVIALFTVLRYVAQAFLRRRPGLFVEDGRLAFLSTKNRSIRLENLDSIVMGREGMFEGEPTSITFNQIAGPSLVVPFSLLATPSREIVARLEAAGVRAPVDWSALEQRAVAPWDAET